MIIAQSRMEGKGTVFHLLSFGCSFQAYFILHYAFFYKYISSFWCTPMMQQKYSLLFIFSCKRLYKEDPL